MTRLRGILFDLGDTLLDFGKVDVFGLFEQGAALGYDYLKSIRQPLTTFPKFFRKQLWAIRWSYFKSRITRREFNSLDLLGRMSTSMGHRLTNDQMLELAWKFYLPLRQQATVESGTRELLQDFRSQGLTLGLVSNTFLPPEVLDRHLQEVDLLDLLPYRVYSSQVFYRKPHPGIFSVALSQARLEAGATLFVGDSLHADIHGANRNGMTSVLKDPTGRHANSRIKPKHRIARLEELRAIVAGYV
ncbi:MAG: HAD family hydrolase [Phycisphaerae bacterium]|nr:HAD family hydrolase [Phycisphaerae bacterium]